MEDVAERIVADLEPTFGWWPSAAAELKDVALTMLQDMDEDSVEECLGSALRVGRGSVW